MGEGRSCDTPVTWALSVSTSSPVGVKRDRTWEWGTCLSRCSDLGNAHLGTFLRRVHGGQDRRLGTYLCRPVCSVLSI